MVEVGGGLWMLSYSTPSSQAQPIEQSAQDYVQTAFKYFHERRFHNVSSLYTHDHHLKKKFGVNAFIWVKVKNRKKKLENGNLIKLRRSL